MIRLLYSPALYKQIGEAFLTYANLKPARAQALAHLAIPSTSRSLVAQATRAPSDILPNGMLNSIQPFVRLSANPELADNGSGNV